MAVVVITRTDGAGELLLDRNAALPEQGIEAARELRAVRTYYPGADVPSVQIMGTKDLPIVMRGTWRDDLLGETGGAFALVQAANALFLSRAECSLQWISDAGEALLTRTGFVDAFTPTYMRGDAVRWSITFGVTGGVESQVIATPAVQPAMPYDLSTLLAELEIIASDVASAATLANNVVRAVT